MLVRPSQLMNSGYEDAFFIPAKSLADVWFQLIISLSKESHCALLTF